MNTRIKICGITRVEDALLAVRLGAHAIGLVLHAPSRRLVTPAQARAIVDALPPFIQTVGLFVNAPRETVAGILDEVPIDILQFHGEETPEDCRGYGRRYLRAVRMAPGVDLVECAVRFSDASALLLDAHVAGAYGGTGHTFDWSRIPGDLTLPVVLSGGLNVGNVAQGVRQVRPFAVDVSSGVESAPGIKDADKLQAFINEVRNADV